MREEVAVGIYGGTNSIRRYISGQPWRKYCGKKGIGNGVIRTHSMGRWEIAEAGEQGLGYAGMEMGDAQVGR